METKKLEIGKEYEFIFAGILKKGKYIETKMLNDNTKAHIFMNENIKYPIKVETYNKYKLNERNFQ